MTKPALLDKKKLLEDFKAFKKARDLAHEHDCSQQNILKHRDNFIKLGDLPEDYKEQAIRAWGGKPKKALKKAVKPTGIDRVIAQLTPEQTLEAVIEIIRRGIIQPGTEAELLKYKKSYDMIREELTLRDKEDKKSKQQEQSMALALKGERYGD